MSSEHRDDRLIREAAFYDQTATSDARAGAAKFYSVTARSRDRYRQLITENVEGMSVLEYGCGTGSSAFNLARCGAQVVGIDISPVQIEMATSQATAEGLSDRAKFVVGDAEALPFEAACFDRVVGGAILHHLDLARSFAEIARVLKPGGSAFFVEPLGHNPLINWYRRSTPQMRTRDEHPLLLSDLALAGRTFPSVRVEYFHLSSLGIVPLRSTRAFGPLYAATERLDRILMALIPPLRAWAWTAVIELRTDWRAR